MTDNVTPKHVAVLGTGRMGPGIAQVFAAAGVSVTLVGRRAESVTAALEAVDASLARAAEAGVIAHGSVAATRARVVGSTDLGDAAESELIIEAVTEDIELKRAVFRELEEVCAADAVIASSSGQPASVLARGARRPSRFIAAHFWYPSDLIPLVEVCAGPETDPTIVPWLRDVLVAVGKVPVVVEHEISGFVGNRLQFAMLREALSLWSQGVASAEDIDKAITQGIGRRLGVTGPLATAALGGIESFKAFAAFLFPDLSNDGAPPRAFTRLAELDDEAERLVALGITDRAAGERLAEARITELLRWARVDRAQSGDPGSS